MSGVLSIRDIGLQPLVELFSQRGLHIAAVAPATAIPGTYWGEPEAGLVGNRVFIRPDTPIHSALHEACHWLCMDAAHRDALHTDAGGTDAEEDAVCYLQILLADRLAGMGRARMLADMDAWGYSFRLGSAARWFNEDAAEARQ